MMLKQQSWKTLTQRGLPQFEVTRRPLLWLGVVYQVGADMPPGISTGRLRQLYEQRRTRARATAETRKSSEKEVKRSGNRKT